MRKSYKVGKTPLLEVYLNHKKDQKREAEACRICKVHTQLIVFVSKLEDLSLFDLP